MTGYLLPLLLLTGIYAMVLGSADPIDLLAGALLSVALLLAFRGFVLRDAPPPGISTARSVVAFFPFAAAVAWDILAGTWTVFRVVLHLRPLSHPGIVLVPIGDRTPTGVAVSALATTVSPGTFLVDVDWERRVMLIHSIDASDPDAVRESLQRFYDRYQRYVFP